MSICWMLHKYAVFLFSLGITFIFTVPSLTFCDILLSLLHSNFKCSFKNVFIMLLLIFFSSVSTSCFTYAQTQAPSLHPSFAELPNLPKRSSFIKNVKLYISNAAACFALLCTVWARAVTVHIIIAKHNLVGNVPPERGFWSSGNWHQLGVCWFDTLLVPLLLPPEVLSTA